MYWFLIKYILVLKFISQRCYFNVDNFKILYAMEYFLYV